MKTLFLVFIQLYLTFALIYAQEKAKIIISNPFPNIETEKSDYFKTDANIVSFKDNKVQLFGIDKMDLVKTSDYLLPKDAKLENICEFDGKFLVFYSSWDKEKKNKQLFYKSISNDLENANAEGILLFTVKGKVSSFLFPEDYLSNKKEHNFGFKYSNDRSKLLIQFRYTEDYSINRIGLFVIGKGLETVLNTEFKAPMCLSTLIDNGGNVFIYTYMFNNNATKIAYEGNKPNIHLEIVKIEAKTAAVSNFPIDYENKFTGFIGLYDYNNENIINAGFTNDVKESYSKEKQPLGKLLNNADGITMHKIGKNGKISDVDNFKIPQEIIEQYTSSKIKNKIDNKEDDSKGEFEDLKLTNLIVQEDGSILIIGEQQYQETTSTKTDPNFKNREVTTATFHYNDMMIAKIDKNWQLSWIKKLPKRQKGNSGLGGMSFKYMKGEDCHYLIFLDNIANLSLTPNDYPAKHEDGKGGFLTAYKVNDSDGKTVKISILDTRNIKEGMAIDNLEVTKIVPISSDSFMFEGNVNKKENVLVKVIF